MGRFRSATVLNSMPHQDCRYTLPGFLTAGKALPEKSQSRVIAPGSR